MSGIVSHSGNAIHAECLGETRGATTFFTACEASCIATCALGADGVVSAVAEPGNRCGGIFVDEAAARHVIREEEHAGDDAQTPAPCKDLVSTCLRVGIDALTSARIDRGEELRTRIKQLAPGHVRDALLAFILRLVEKAREEQTRLQ